MIEYPCKTCPKSGTVHDRCQAYKDKAKKQAAINKSFGSYKYELSVTARPVSKSKRR